MISKIAEYKVRGDDIETVVAAIKKFTAAVEENEPDTQYSAYRREESDEFIHFMTFPDEAAEKDHAKSHYTEQFVNVLYPRCTDQPVFTDITPVD